MFLKILGQRVCHRRFHRAFDLGVAELGLGLALKLGVSELHAYHCREPFSHILPKQVGLVIPQEFVPAGIIVDGPGEGGAEAGQVSATLLGIDTVSEGKDRLVIAIVVLDGGLDDDAINGLEHVERLFLKHLPVPVDTSDQTGQAAIEVIRPLIIALPLFFMPAAGKADLKALVQKGDLLEVGR